MKYNSNEFEYNYRKYLYYHDKDVLNMFDVEYAEKTKIPDYFTKYYKICDYNIEAVLNNYLYAAHPKQFNDPFDCFSRLLDTTEITELDLKYFQDFLKIFDLKKSDILLNKRTFADYLIDFFYCFSGIISMNDSSNENPQLWANYSDNHYGFSVTYKKDALKTIANGPFKIDYLEEFKKIPLDKERFDSQLLCLSLVKGKYWDNEKEWRFICSSDSNKFVPSVQYSEKDKELLKENRKIPLPENSITEIKLGFKFFINMQYSKNDTQYVCEFGNDRKRGLKKKLLNFANKHKDKIKLSIIHLHCKNFEFGTPEIDWQFIPETYTFKYKIIDNKYTI